MRLAVFYWREINDCRTPDNDRQNFADHEPTTSVIGRNVRISVGFHVTLKMNTYLPQTAVISFWFNVPKFAGIYCASDAFFRVTLKMNKYVP